MLGKHEIFYTQAGKGWKSLFRAPTECTAKINELNASFKEHPCVRDSFGQMSIVMTLLHKMKWRCSNPHTPSWCSSLQIHLCFGYKYLTVYACMAVPFHLNCTFPMYVFVFARLSIKHRVLGVAILSGKMASSEYTGTEIEK